VSELLRSIAERPPTKLEALSPRHQNQLIKLACTYGAELIAAAAHEVPALLQATGKRSGAQWACMQIADTIETLAASYRPAGQRGRFNKAYAELFPKLRLAKDIDALKKYHQRGRSYWIELSKRDPRHVPDWVRDIK
jgi:hypothetical protein